MIDHFHLCSFKGHRDTQVPLGRFTVLVGDNASGKTSVLEAMWLQARLAEHAVDTLRGDHLPADLLTRDADGPITLRAAGRSAGGPWHTTIQIGAGSTDARSWFAMLHGELGGAAITAKFNSPGGALGDWRTYIGATSGAAGLYHFRAETIAAAAYSPDPATRVDIDGANTAVVLSAMKLGNDETFLRVEEAMRRLVPTVKRVRIRPTTVEWPRAEMGEVVGSKIYFDFTGASGVPAQHASHGTLIVLSLLTVLFSARRPNLILLDDFDHALHPRAQMALVRMIKELLTLDEFEDLQVVATTHSPYTLDELDPEDVQAFALRGDGTVASKRLSAHPEAGRMMGVLKAGQLWSLDPERDWVLKE